MREVCPVLLTRTVAVCASAGADQRSAPPSASRAKLAARRNGAGRAEGTAPGPAWGRSARSIHARAAFPLRRSTSFQQVRRVQLIHPVTRSGCRCDRSHTTASSCAHGHERTTGRWTGLSAFCCCLHMGPLGAGGLSARLACMPQARARNGLVGASGSGDREGGEIGGRAAWMSFTPSGRRPQRRRHWRRRLYGGQRPVGPGAFQRHCRRQHNVSAIFVRHLSKSGGTLG